MTRGSYSLTGVPACPLLIRFYCRVVFSKTIVITTAIEKYDLLVHCEESFS
jgi:hypothetical protein